MPYSLKCTECQQEYTRSYLALSKKCPRCGSADVAMIYPSQKVGYIIFTIGIILLILLLLEMFTFINTGGSPEATIVGSGVVALLGYNLASLGLYCTLTMILTIVITAIFLTGLNIAFGKRVDY